MTVDDAIQPPGVSTFMDSIALARHSHSSGTVVCFALLSITRHSSGTRKIVEGDDQALAYSSRSLLDSVNLHAVVFRIEETRNLGAACFRPPGHFGFGDFRDLHRFGELPCDHALYCVARRFLMDAFLQGESVEG